MYYLTAGNILIDECEDLAEAVDIASDLDVPCMVTDFEGGYVGGNSAFHRVTARKLPTKRSQLNHILFKNIKGEKK